MSNKTLLTIRKLCTALLSLLLIMTGVLLITGCVSIYQSGPRPFTPESISAMFRKIQVPIYITLSMMLITVIMHLICPVPQKKNRIAVEKKVILHRMEKRLSQNGISLLTPTVKRERLLRRLLWIVAIAICAVLFIPAAQYTFDPAHFTLTSFNEDTASATWYLIPAFLLSSIVIILAIYVQQAGYTRDIDRAKKLLAKAPKEKNDTHVETVAQPSSKTPQRVIWGVRLGLLILGVTFIILGIFNGGMADVLSKAINICTECIGLG